MFAGQTLRPRPEAYVSSHVTRVATILVGVAVTAAIVLAIMLTNQPRTSHAVSAPPANVPAAPAPIQRPGAGHAGTADQRPKHPLGSSAQRPE